ncbi:hypothetical protein [Ferruginibacter albus]|uniref:hypothetical protein n=1 Tax=Ferruginibacter albus TaxID=2875540 RepID=UPI001CC68A13|nr:hypothetical protein [Ferruginibacter albus]UAY53593.1 hypothetical protein K9M53_07980 [Ferruginibacter albus]
MKFYNKIIQVNVEKEKVIKAWSFAKDVVATIDYSDSNQTNLQKIRIDHFVSKIGEEACKMVMSKFAKVKEPDYTIYSADEKSWEDDLYVNEIGVAVKTQRRSDAKKYSLSWTFQAGKYRRDIILDDPDAWVVFVECDDEDPYQCYVYPPYQIKELSFGEPRLSRLKDSKKVVYANALPGL